MRACLALQRLVPPKMLGVVLVLEEAGLGAAEEGLGSQLHGIAEEREVDVGIEVDSHGTGVETRHTQFASQIEVERTALRLGQLGTDIGAVARPAVEDIVVGTFACQLWHLILAIFVRGKELETCLDILVKAFEQGYSESVLDGSVLKAVVDGVAGIGSLVILIIISVGIVVRRGLIGLIDAVVAVDVEGVDNAGYGDVLLLHRRVDGVLDGLQAVETVEFGL